MKLLIYGAGVVGSIYGWQLSEAGHEVTVLVRKEKEQQLAENGITIHCTDFRGGKKQLKQIVFYPDVIDEIPAQHDFEYIVVSTTNLHLKKVLPELAKSAGKAHILFFLNLWNELNDIAGYLSPGQYFFGFPFMAGGGKNNQTITCAISGLKYSHTPLGELSGETTPRLENFARVLEAANLKPVITDRIKVWLLTHYVVAAGLSAGIITAGGGKAFADNSEVIKRSIQAIREGFAICVEKGVDPRSEKSNKLYSLPLFIGVLIARKVYADEALTIMFDGHTNHSPGEIGKMLDDLIADGEKFNVPTPGLKNFRDKIQSSI